LLLRCPLRKREEKALYLSAGMDPTTLRQTTF
jgi:hypothetical protein